jgi:HD-like signal output (HDOD) protein
MIGTFENREDRSSFDINQYWKRSLALALLAQEMALIERREDTESAFLSGLLYDIGVLVLRQYFPDAFAEICELMSSKKCGFAEACGTIGYLDHRQIGRLIAMRWNLPKKILYVFAGPSESLLDYVEVTANRNTVLFSDCQLTLNGVYTWDVHQKADPNHAKLCTPGEEFLKEFLKKLVSDVHELRAAM